MHSEHHQIRCPLAQPEVPVAVNSLKQRKAHLDRALQGQLQKLLQCNSTQAGRGSQKLSRKGERSDSRQRRSRDAARKSRHHCRIAVTDA